MSDPSTPPTQGLFAALDRAVFAETEPGLFEALDSLPGWALGFLPGDDLRAVPLAERFLFLETFLEEAREHWDSEPADTLRSGPWTEADKTGTERRLEAVALFHKGRRILVLEALGPEYDEMQAVLQKARETMLSYQRLGRLSAAVWAGGKRAREAVAASPDTTLLVAADGSYQDLASVDSSPRPLAELMPDEAERELRQTLFRVLDGGRATTVEFEQNDAWFEARLVRFDDQRALALIRDVTKRKRMQQELAERLSRLRARRDVLSVILDELGVGALLINQEGRCTWAGAAALKLLDLEGDAMRGSGWTEIASKNRERKALAETAARPAADRQRVAVTAPNGRAIDVEVKDDPLRPERRIAFLYDVSEVHALRRMLDDRVEMDGMVGADAAMQEVFRLIEDFAQFESTVLIEGETGSGKELAARALHNRSPRAKGPFVAVNCAGLSESLVASQLFGHRRGAFTGAVQDQKGVFEAADGGTLFLDEVGDIPATVQTSLLRALQEREILRVGDVQPRKVDVRVVAATHRDLARAVEEGAFRADLLYRIRVARIRLPPLRERRGDIRLLADRFLTEMRAVTGRPVEEFAPDALRRLLDYPWPGNVRELRSAIELATIRCRGKRIEPFDLPPELASMPAPAGETEDEERERYREALAAADGNRTQAAKRLGVSRATLYRRLEQLGLADPS